MNSSARAARTTMLLALGTFVSHPFPAPAQPSNAAQNPVALPAEGLWVATRRFGPPVRGTLVITREGSGLRAEISGHSVIVRSSGDDVSLALPDSSGWLVARRSRDGATITGHWIQPRIMSSGQKQASPIVLRRQSADKWVGEVVPLEDAMTIYLVLRKRPNGALAAFIRNPERNLGMQLRADRLEMAGTELRLMGRWNGRDPERVLAAGTARERDFSLYLQGRGGTFDFRRVGDGEHTDFYPRGRPTASYTYRQPPALNDGWTTASLSAVGLSQDSITRFVHMLANAPMDSLASQQIHAFLLARHGKLVVEEYFHGESRDKAHDSRSAGKSLATTLAGAAIHSGLPVSLSSRVFEVMDGGRFASSVEKRSITLEHLLGMSTGLDCDDSDPKSLGNESTITDQDDEPDYYKMILALGTVREAGSRAVYCSASAHLAGGLLRVATGRSLPTLFQTLLAQPLGIGRYYLPLTPTDDVYFGGGIRLTARDYAKIGQLYLDDGVWKGRRILDSAFVARASQPRFDLAGIRYGLLWWVIDYPYKGGTIQGYFAGGNGGQLVMVIPSLDMVVTFYGGNYGDYTRTLHAQRNYLPTYILPSVMTNAGRTRSTR